MKGFQDREKKIKERLEEVILAIKKKMEREESKVKMKEEDTTMYFIVGFVVGAIFSAMSLNIILKKVKHAVYNS